MQNLVIIIIMKIKFLIFTISLCLSWASQTRMNVLLCGDYIDDPVNIDVFPQHIMVFQNYFYGDILKDKNTYGVIFSPLAKYGGIGFWHKEYFTIGYAITLGRFDIGFFGSPVKDQTRIGIGIGCTRFDSRGDISLVVNRQPNINESYNVNIRCLKRKGDFIFIPKYNFNDYSKPANYLSHKIGLMLERLILNDGFVYLAVEYTAQDGAIKADFTNLLSGLELPLNKTFILRLGMREKFNEDLVPTDLQMEIGLGLKIREFDIHFHLNRERFFTEELTFFNSLGLDLNFGRF